MLSLQCFLMNVTSFNRCMSMFNTHSTDTDRESREKKQTFARFAVVLEVLQAVLLLSCFSRTSIFYLHRPPGFKLYLNLIYSICI